jgi:XapX domain-containing protein
MIKYALGVVIALLIGAACRFFELPVPAPPKLQGAILVLALTCGYVGADFAINKLASSSTSSDIQHH